MFFADCHTHSVCSFDGIVPMPEMARMALQYGLSCLTITDHCDLLDENGVFTPVYDWVSVEQQRKAMLGAFGTKLDLPLGIEFGMGFIDPEVSKNILSHEGLDFVIGSVHNESREKGGGDFYYLNYQNTEDCHRALEDYFSSLISLAKSPFYDVIGHIIYPMRYMVGPFPSPTLERHQDKVREIMRLAIESGRGIEINTWTGDMIEEWRPILETYKELGGEIITVGSDAHAAPPIGRGIPEIYRMMQDCGFRYAAVYHERKPQMYKL